MIKKVLLCLFINVPVFAQATSEEIKETLSKNAYEPNYFSMILGLFLVIVLIYLTGFLYQKLMKVNIAPKDVEVIKPQIISTTSLGQGGNLHVVKIGDDICLLGATQNNITYLKEIKNELDKKLEKEGVEGVENCKDCK